MLQLITEQNETPLLGQWAKLRTLPGKTCVIEPIFQITVYDSLEAKVLFRIAWGAFCQINEQNESYPWETEFIPPLGDVSSEQCLLHFKGLIKGKNDTENVISFC